MICVENGSQWDGLRHASQSVPAKGDEPPPERVFYGGTTAAEIQDRHSDRIGMQHWAQAGIAGRGVLIDYVSYAEKKGIKYSSFEVHQFKLSEIIEIAKDCNIEFRKGDILLVHSGTTKAWDGMSRAEKAAYSAAGRPLHAGLEATEDMLRFLWDSGFAAVASDMFAFEVGILRSGGEPGYVLTLCYLRCGHHKVLSCCTSTYLRVGGCR